MRHKGYYIAYMTKKSMTITLNGEAYALEASLNVAELITRLGADPRALAVERNGQILPKSSYEATELEQDDRLEIIGFIGGG
jgi:thiamine biosynthesis protein ThiS